MHLICRPNFCITFVFHFSCVLQPFQEKLKKLLMQKFWEANKVHYGRCASGVLWPKVRALIRGNKVGGLLGGSTVFLLLLTLLTYCCGFFLQIRMAKKKMLTSHLPHHPSIWFVVLRIEIPSYWRGKVSHLQTGLLTTPLRIIFVMT